jgi:Transposase DNA-binding/Transposase Tn5 dimerisation domain
MALGNWASRELIGAEFGDARLTDRLIAFVEAAAAHPEAGIPEACGKAGSKAAYRFFQNKRVEPDRILAPHAQRTVQRAKEFAVVLAPQDTTTFSFPSHPSTRGLGYVTTDPDSLGFLMHSVMLVSPEGTPLGVLDEQMWSRDSKDYGKSEQRRQRKIEEKESRRWLSGVTAVEKALPDHPCVVVIGDQESDIFELFAAPRKANVHLLVRACRSGRRVQHEDQYLENALKNSPPRGQFNLVLPRADDRPSRTAVLTLRWMTLLISPPRNQRPRIKLPPQSLQFLLAEEEHPPQGQKRVRWLLATTLPIENWEDAVRLLTWYTYRWRIERFHYVLKSGCRIEQLQLEAAERLQCAVACYSIVAMRLMWLTYESREHPDRSCVGILATHEWQSLHARVHPHAAIPHEPPNLHDAVRMIAQLGGFQGRKGDGEPGLKTLWRGMRRLEDISIAWQLAKQYQDASRTPTQYQYLEGATCG